MASFNGLVAELSLAGKSEGPLAGRTFVAKDLFDVAKHRTSAGNPTWLATHEPAVATASSIKSLLDAGANLIGKSCTDELAFSLDGINIHYGTPINPQAPDRIPGGSSSGSASAVASGLCDFALGTDTAGSVRVPASYCGIFGIRPTHGRIRMDGIVPLGPDFDTVGWMAKDPELLRSCGEVLLGERQDSGAPHAVPTRLKLVSDAFAMVTDDLYEGIEDALKTLSIHFRHVESITFGSDQLDEWVACFNTVRGRQAWQCHGDWIESVQPNFAEEIGKRFLSCKDITEKQAVAAAKERELAIQAIASHVDESTVLCLPTTYCLPPLKSAPLDELAENRKANMRICSLASISGLPQITIPVKVRDDFVSGISFIGRRHSDLALLDLAVNLKQGVLI